MKLPLVLSLLSLALLAATGGQTSALWGDPATPTWDPATSRLRDFTNVGYMQGAVPIPNWPVGVNVTDPAFGAVPDDDIDDSQAFINAIAACPDHHAVFVPKGRYLITQEIRPQRDHFVLRGEDMYGTVLFFPKYLDEAYIQEIGWSDDGTRNTGSSEGFITMDGGTEKSIENLSLVFREQRKGGVWEYLGADPLCYTGSVTHSWGRNVCIKNYDLGFKVTRASNLSVINLKLDQFPGRRSIVGTAPSGPPGTVPLDEYGEKMGIPGFDALFGVMPRRVENSLFHDIEVNGFVMQPIDMNESPNNNVFSGIRATLRAVGYHGDGLCNLLERAFKTSPIDSADWVAMPNAGLIRQGETDHLSITYRQLRGGTGTTGIDYKVSGITYTVEHDSDLAGLWNMGSVVPVDDPVNNGDGTETVTVRLLDDITNGNSRFMRLKISAEP